MNISVFACGKNVYVNHEYIKSHTFNKELLWEKSALLTKFMHLLTANFAVKGILLSIYRKITDRFECLLPQIK